ncbi:MAG: hypothetical protein LBK58_08805 [Prevotellaceae bacterium]|jgi:hypothetical protein|nr:hypothetical protein [Prevotellaceae bacterium]
MRCVIWIFVALTVSLVLIDSIGAGYFIGLLATVFLIFVFLGKSYRKKESGAENSYKSDEVKGINGKELYMETAKTQERQVDKKYINGVPFWLQQSNPADSDVIDVASDPVCIITGQEEEKEQATYGEEYFTEAPYWDFHYVYSYDDIRRASKRQRQFYFFFKKKFMNGEFPDLQGNMNYAFVLLYDISNEYDKTGDIDELEKRLKLLGQHYHRTKAYTISLLLKKMRDSGYGERAQMLHENECEYWKLGVKYRDKLQLSREEIKHLNNLHCSSNKFNSIDFCMTETVKLYRSVINELEKRHAHEDAAIYGFRQNGGYLSPVVWNLYTFIFRHCENAVREYYGYGPKLNTNENETVYKSKVVIDAIELIPSFIHNILPPDRDTELILNRYCPNRWKKRIKKLEKNYENGSQFLNGLIRMCPLDCIPETVFYDAATFMLKRDIETAIKLYLYYLSGAVRDRLTATENILHLLTGNREPDEDPVLSRAYSLNIAIIKLLKHGQIQTFKDILTTFVQNNDLSKAIDSVPDIYRKKIRIDSGRIEKIQRQHAKSISVLNEYMDDGTEDENVSGSSDAGNSVELSPETGNAGILFSQIQTAVLSMFENGGYSVLQCDVEAFARSQGALKNQIVGSINNICYEHLDDVLIEESEEYYTVNPEYCRIIHALWK